MVEEMKELSLKVLMLLLLMVIFKEMPLLEEMVLQLLCIKIQQLLLMEIQS